MSFKGKVLLNKKAQVFTWDIVFAMIVFFIVLGILIYLWSDTVEKMTTSEIEYELSWLSTAVSEQLVRTLGIPYNWIKDPEPDNITVIGLADSETIGNSTKVLDRILDPDKLMHFINITQNNYLAVRNKLLGSGKYDFYAEISCLNQSDICCFEGLYLDTIKDSIITCGNGFNFSISENHIRGIYLWREAEGYDDESGISVEVSPKASEPLGGTSNNSWVERLNNINNFVLYNFAVPCDMGIYSLWTRYAKDDLSSSGKIINISLDNTTIFSGPYNGTKIGGGSAFWKWKPVGNLTLSKEKHTLKIGVGEPGGGSAVFLDTLLLTTNLRYTPSDTVPSCGYFGCEPQPTKCIIGNHVIQENTTHMVHDTKTATFSEESDTKGIEEDIPFLEPTARINFMVYKLPTELII